MKNISSETQLYVQLAARGDPSAFYALFHGRIRGLYLLLRSQGKDHEAACGEAVRRLGDLYGRFIHSPPWWGRADRWFAARCGLKRFDAEAAVAAVAGDEVAAYERLAVGAVNRAYCERLKDDGDDGGNIVTRAPLARRVAWTVAAVLAIGFLFFSRSVLSVSFGRFGAEYKLSFPKLAEGLWDISGLVRMESGHSAPQGTETGPRP
jgi:hypothetical protein